MNIRDLKYIVAVAENGSFSRASEMCFVSQPALSMQVKKLEESIDTKIFERSGKKVALTKKGSELVLKAKTILAQVDEFHEIAHAHENPLEGDVSIGAFPTISPYLLPRILPVFMERYAKLNFNVYEHKTGDLIDKLLSKQLDVALIALPVKTAGITGIKVLEEEFFLCVHKGNRLFEKENVSYDDLEDQTLLLLEEGHCLRDQALDICGHANVEMNKKYTSASLETLIAMVAQGLGITLVPQMATKHQHDAIRYLPFSVNEPMRSVALCWNEGSSRDIVFRRLAHSLQSLQL